MYFVLYYQGKQVILANVFQLVIDIVNSMKLDIVSLFNVVLPQKPPLKKVTSRGMLRDIVHQVYHHHVNLSLVTIKPVFGVSDKVRLKPACAATEAS